MDSYKEIENNLETLKGIIELSTDLYIQNLYYLKKKNPQHPKIGILMNSEHNVKLNTHSTQRRCYWLQTCIRLLTTCCLYSPRIIHYTQVISS